MRNYEILYTNKSQETKMRMGDEKMNENPKFIEIVT
jgi:hypothetical protein